MDSVVATPNLIEIIITIGGTTLLILLLAKYTQPAFKEYIAKRKAYINSTVEKTAEDGKKAELKLQEVTQREQEIKSKKAEILDRAKDEAATEKSSIIKASKEEARLIIEKANAEVEQDKKRVQDELSAEMMELVNAVSAKFIAQNITEEEEMQLINQAIGKVNEN